MEIDPANLGTLDLDEMWVPYVDMNDGSFLPTRVKIVNDEYAFESSIIILGHGAVLPGRIRDLRNAGKKAIIIERSQRYYVYVTPP
ncbi:MAG TPA: hypothetical protein VIH21_03570 [Dehalococcoidia bacterium]